MQKALTFPGAPLGGTAMITAMTEKLQALASSRKGSARPSDAVTGEIWIDDSADPSWVVNCYDGTNDIPLMTINATDNTVFFNLCDLSGLSGSEFIRLNADLDGFEGVSLPIADYLKKDTSAVLSAGYFQNVETITDAATPTIDLAASNYFEWTMTADRTFPLLAPDDPGRWMFRIRGDYTLTIATGYDKVAGVEYDGSGTNANFAYLVDNGSTTELFLFSIPAV